MLGLDPTDLPEIQEKYAKELWNALKNRGEQSPETNLQNHSTPKNAEWIF